MFLTFEEAIRGMKKMAEINKKVDCLYPDLSAELIRASKQPSWCPKSLYDYLTL